MRQGDDLRSLGIVFRIRSIRPHEPLEALRGKGAARKIALPDVLGRIGEIECPERFEEPIGVGDLERLEVAFERADRMVGQRHDCLLYTSRCV